MPFVLVVNGLLSLACDVNIGRSNVSWKTSENPLIMQFNRVYEKLGNPVV